MQQALLGGDQRAIAVDGDRAALEDEIARADALLPQPLQQPRRDLGVIGERLELLAPGVEAEVDARAPPGAVEDEERARVAHPRVVDRDLGDGHALAARLAGAPPVPRAG